MDPWLILEHKPAMVVPCPVWVELHAKQFKNVPCFHRPLSRTLGGIGLFGGFLKLTTMSVFHCIYWEAKYLPPTVNHIGSGLQFTRKGTHPQLRKSQIVAYLMRWTPEGKLWSIVFMQMMNSRRDKILPCRSLPVLTGDLCSNCSTSHSVVCPTGSRVWPAKCVWICKVRLGSPSWQWSIVIDLWR